MRILIWVLCCVFCCENAYSYIADQNLFFLSGKDVAITEGDTRNRAIYYLEIPQNFEGKLYIRIFDADLAGKHDLWQEGSQVLYHVYGNGDIDWTLRTISDPIRAQDPLAEMRLAENRYYDDQWRTIAALDLSDGELQDAKRYFQLIVDGLTGRAINKYQVFASASEKENKIIEGSRIFSPVLMLRLPPAPDMATQIRFDIPEDAEYLTIFNFDADLADKKTRIDFETQFSQHIPISASQDGQESSSKVMLGPEERGKTGALVIRNTKEANNLQIWIFDDQGNPVPLLLPVFLGPDNQLPLAEFAVVPLSECGSVLLDASGSSDADNDELSFEWVFPDGRRSQGSRIVHNFNRAGRYEISLIVSDRSGFVANSHKVTKTIQINEPPIATIQAPEKAIPGKSLLFDASASQDADGTILNYLWNFGDGTKAQGEKLEHSYARPGKYQVALLVEDDSQSLCNQARATHWVRINTPPVPRLNIKAIGAVGESITISAQGSVDSDGEILAYHWDFGDQTTAEGEQVSHQWEQPGSYTVRLTVTDDAGLANSSTEERADIIINAPPVPRVKYPEIIAAQEEVLFNGTPSADPDGTISRYVWNMDDGTALEGAEIRHAYKAPGLYTATLTVTDNTDTLNNSVSTMFPVRVNHPPVPVAGEDRVVNTSKVTFDAGASTDQDDPIIDYLWDFGDGSRVHGETVSHVYAFPGTYRVSLSVTDGSGTQSASQSDSVEITVNHPPIADAGTAQVVSVEEPVALDGSFSDDPDGTLVAYQWEVQEGVLLTGERVEYQYTRPGRYQVRLTVVDDVGTESIDYTVITVNAAPVADFSPLKRVAPGQSVQFDGTISHDPDGHIRLAWWNFGDGTPVKEGLSAEHSFESPGRYAVTLTVQDDSEAAENTVSRTRMIAVNYPPLAHAGEEIHICSQKVRFDASKSTDPDGDLLRYVWDFGDGTQAQGRSPEHSYLSPGIYPISLTVDDGHGLNNSVSHANTVAYVNAPPVASLQVNSQTVCAGELVLFDASNSSDLEKGLLRYIWDLGDGEPQEGVNPVRSYTQGGDYRIRLKVTDDSQLACNTSDAETILHVIDAPIANAGADQTVCANTLVQFDASASTGGGRRIKSYEWEFGDGQAGVGISPAHVYAQEGEYDARLVISVSGESECANVSEDAALIRVLEAPSALLQAPKAGCVDERIMFDASESKASNGNISEFLWDFGDGASASGEKASHAFDAPGEYPVTLKIMTDSEGGCNSAEYSETMIINSVPSPVIHLTAAGNAPFNGKVYETEVATILRFSAAESTDSDGYIRSYTWDFGDEQQGNGPFVTHRYERSGEYLLTLTIQDDSASTCNTSSSTLTLRVREPELQHILGPESVCTGQEVHYTVPSDGPLEWVFNDGMTNTGNPVTRTFTAPGPYQIQAKVGQDWMPTKEVTVLELPAMTLPERIDVYPDDPVDIQPVYNRLYEYPLVFQWEMGDGTRLNTDHIRHLYTQPGEYTLELTVTIEDGPECLQARYQLPVLVHDPPEVTIQVTPEEIFTGGARDAALFEAVTTGDQGNWNYQWDFGDGETATGKRVSHTYKTPGNFQVTVTLSNAFQRTSQTYTFSQQVEVVSRK